ncbi:MAG TPA: hypothetical protein VGE74_01720 [Gemmata sp.]
MHPVLRRILLHGGLTALVLALIGMLFAELANIWLVGNAPRSAAGEATDPVGATLRTRVPVVLAGWGFVFVMVGEIVIWRVRGARPTAPKPADLSPDDAEKLLNELLAQAEAKMAAEAARPATEQGTPGVPTEAGSGDPTRTVPPDPQP